MRKYHILVDMDDVVVDLMGPWAQWINENGDPDHHVDKTLSWNIDEHTSIGTKCFDIFLQPNLFESLKAKPNAIKYLSKLYFDGHKIQFCTHPPSNSPDAKAGKRKWLEKNIKWFKEKDLIFSDDKGSVPGEILFDDRVKWLVEFPGISICMEMPYNTSWEGLKVKNWEAFYELIDSLSK